MTTCLHTHILPIHPFTGQAYSLCRSAEFVHKQYRVTLPILDTRMYMYVSLIKQIRPLLQCFERIRMYSLPSNSYVQDIMLMYYYV